MKDRDGLFGETLGETYTGKASIFAFCTAWSAVGADALNDTHPQLTVSGQWFLGLVGTARERLLGLQTPHMLRLIGLRFSAEGQVQGVGIPIMEYSEADRRRLLNNAKLVVMRPSGTSQAPSRAEEKRTLRSKKKVRQLLQHETARTWRQLERDSLIVQFQFVGDAGC